MSIFKKHVVIPAGSTFTVSTGEYSDYSVHGVFRALKEIDPKKLADDWLERYPNEAEGDSFNESKFLGEAFRAEVCLSTSRVLSGTYATTRKSAKWM